MALVPSRSPAALGWSVPRATQRWERADEQGRKNLSGKLLGAQEKSIFSWNHLSTHREERKGDDVVVCPVLEEYPKSSAPLVPQFQARPQGVPHSCLSNPAGRF